MQFVLRPTVVAAGGGLEIRSCSPEVTNNIISGNNSRLGGGVNVTHVTQYSGIPRPVFINNTITDNNATDSGGGLRMDDVGGGSPQALATVMNTILWGNSAPTGPQIYIATSGGVANVRYSDVQGGWAGEGNIDADPFFTDPLYNLGDSSLCIGAGIDSIQIDTTWYYAPSYDFDGDPRPNPPGYMPDIGAQESPLGMPVAIEPLPGLLPSTYALRQNYPNPFNPTTNIGFRIAEFGFVSLTVYDIIGRRVATLVSENLMPGEYKYTWDAKGLASGVYYYRLETNHGFVQTKKMLLIR